MKKKNVKRAGVLLLVLFLLQTVCCTAVWGKDKQEEADEETDYTESLKNVEEEDAEGLHITAGTVKKGYLPFEKIRLILMIENTGYPEIKNVKAELSAPSGFRLKPTDDKTAKRDSLGLGEVMTIEYEGYHTTAILMFMIVGGGIIVLLVFFFLLLRFIKNRKRRRQFTATIVLVTLLAEPVTAFAENLSESAIEDSILANTDTEDIIWENTEVSLEHKIQVGLSKPEIQYHVSFDQAVCLKAHIDQAKDGDITLAWNEIEGLESYEIYKKSGSGEYNLEGDTTDREYRYQGIAEGGVETFQIVGYYEDGEKSVSSNECRYIFQEGEEFIDSDGDNLQDFLEEQFGTSTELADTDGDGLLDSTEIYVTFTNPLLADTDGDGINDGEADMDNDGLSNLWEQKLGTSPLNADSDGDGLLDGEEWPEGAEEPYSDPLSYDSDEDGLNDKMEKELGTDPWKADSDGDGVLDFEDTYTKDYQMPKSDSVIQVTAPAEALINAEILDYTYSCVLTEKDYVVSEVTCMNMEDEFEAASVTMKIQEEKVPDGDYENVAMFYYNEEKNGFEKMENQSYDDETHTITAETTHFSTFVLVYVPNWHSQFEAAVAPERDDVLADVSFVIDESSSMEDSSKGEANDPERFRVQAAKNFTEALIEGDRACVVGFAAESRRKCQLTEDMEEVRSHIDEIVGNAGGTAMYTGIRDALNELTETSDGTRTQFMIVLSDGEDTSSEDGAYEEIIAAAQMYGIAIYTIALGAGADVSILSQLAVSTGGDYFKIEKAEDLPQVYSRIANNAVMGEDSDMDGLADKVEEYGIRDGLGNIYYTDADVYDTDGDEISDGEEAGGIFTDGEEDYYIVLTDPTNPDTDGDGLSDLEEQLAGTLPWCWDTDGDGLTDGEEWREGFDPRNANPDGDAYGDYAEYYDSAKTFAEFVNLDGMDSEDWLYKFCDLINRMLDRDPYVYDLCDAEICFSILSAILIGDFGTNLVEAGILDANYVNNFYYLAGNIIGGLIPGWDKISSVRDMIADFIQGDYVGATLNAVGAIPAFGEASEVMADVTNALAKTMDDLPNLRRVVLWLSDGFRTSAKFFYTQDMFLEAGKKVIKNGLKNVVTGKGLQMAQLVEDYCKYIDDTEIIFTRRLMGLSDNAIHFGEELTGNPQQLASLSRNALDNKTGGKVVEEIVDGSTQKVYKKVSVLNLDAETYKNPSNITSTLKKRVETVMGFGGNLDVDMTGVTLRQLDIVVPNTLMTEDISEALVSAQNEALSYGVQIQYTVYTADGRGGTFFDDMQNMNTSAKTAGSVKQSRQDTDSSKNKDSDTGGKTDDTGNSVNSMQQKSADLARKASKKPANVKGDPDEVMLGRHLAATDADGLPMLDESGLPMLADNSYEKLAQDRGCWYFQLDSDEWNQLEKQYGRDYMWTINQSFLDQMMENGKTFLLSVDPSSAAGSYYEKEVEYLKSKGYEKILELWKE